MRNTNSPSVIYTSFRRELCSVLATRTDRFAAKPRTRARHLMPSGLIRPSDLVSPPVESDLVPTLVARYAYAASRTAPSDSSAAPRAPPVVDREAASHTT